jgi:hypothetical protein
MIMVAKPACIYIVRNGGKKWQEEMARRNGGKIGGGKTEAGSGGKNWQQEIRREKIDTKKLRPNKSQIIPRNEKPSHIVFLCHILTSTINKKCLYTFLMPYPRFTPLTLAGNGVKMAGMTILS